MTAAKPATGIPGRPLGYGAARAAQFARCGHRGTSEA